MPPAARGAPAGGAASTASSTSGRERLIPDPNPAGSETGTSAATLDANPGSPSAGSAAGSAVTERLRADPYGGFASARRALAPRSEGATSSMAADMDAELAELRHAAPRSVSSGGGGMTLVRAALGQPRNRECLREVLTARDAENMSVMHRMR